MRSHRQSHPVITGKNCEFCKNTTLPDYKDVGTLGKYLTDRGKIIGKARSGICSKHQRLLTREIMRSRFMALLPFVVRS